MAVAMTEVMKILERTSSIKETLHIIKKPFVLPDPGAPWTIPLPQSISSYTQSSVLFEKETDP